MTDLTGVATEAAGQGAKRKAPLLRQAPLLRLDRPVEQRRVLVGGWLCGAHRVREHMARQKTCRTGLPTQDVSLSAQPPKSECEHTA